MAVIKQFFPEQAQFLATVFPQFLKRNGTNFPVSSLAYDASADEAAFWKLVSNDYTSGNPTLDIYWYADTASSGVVRWGASIAAITPDTDTQDVETKSLATEQTFDDTHLGTTGKRVHKATITISNLDSLAGNDTVWLRIRRIGSNGSDTMSGDALLLLASLSY